MAILKKDSGIIKSINGEVIKQSPAIEINSTYGVTKDGSNVVTEWLGSSHNDSIVFTSDVSTYNPTFVDNKVLFDNDLLVSDNDFHPNIVSGFIFKAAVTPLYLTGSEQILFGRWVAVGTPYRDWSIAIRGVDATHAVVCVMLQNTVGAVTLITSTESIEINKLSNIQVLITSDAVNTYFTFTVNTLTESPQVINKIDLNRTSSANTKLSVGRPTNYNALYHFLGYISDVTLYNTNEGSTDKLLHIDTDLQQVNKIFKDSNNKVRQITDKAQGIPFVQTDPAKQPTYNYDGYYEFNETQTLDSLPNSLWDLGNDWTLKFWLYIDSTGTAYGVILSTDNQLGGVPRQWYISTLHDTILIYDGVTSVYFDYHLGYDTFNEVIVQHSNSNENILIVNGVVELKIASSLNGFPSGGQLCRLGGHYQAGNKFKGRLGGLTLHKKAPISYSGVSIGDKVALVKEPFHYQKRYRPDENKKLFLSSKYLKDSEINSADRIKRIYSFEGRVNDTSQPTSSLWAKLTTQGFKLGDESTQAYLSIDTVTTDAFGDKDFFIGVWAKPTDYSNNRTFISMSDGQNTLDSAFRLFKSHLDGTTKWEFSDGVIAYESTDLAIPLNSFNYQSAVRMGDTIYILVGGVLVDTIALPAGYSLRLCDRIYLGNILHTNSRCFIGYLDDFLLIVGSSNISCDGKSIGDKVFEPPRKRSGRSEFVIF